MPLPINENRAPEKRASHNAAMKRYWANNPEQRQKNTQRIIDRYHSDPEYRERRLANSRAHYQRKKDARLAAAAAVAEAAVDAPVVESPVLEAPVVESGPVVEVPVLVTES